MSLKQRVDRLGGTRTITMWPDGVTDLLPQEAWVAILDAPDQDAVSCCCCAARTTARSRGR